ncbi:Transmembrane protein TauE-like [Dillenia turbinata]|uniref:Transmembrane protein TauE-like n=1 Tax=Dillenia turbinata TaxID=194707 RepID=A0AAN8UWX5_9MAGN
MPNKMNPILETLLTSNITHQWIQNHFKQSKETHLEITSKVLISGVLCFLSASISSAGGIGGGGLFIPILSIVAGFDLKTASSFSAFMVTGGSIASVLCNMFITSPKHSHKVLINYDIALLSEPCMLLGVSIGVICNGAFPEWLITIMFAVFLAWSTFKTCKSGVIYWKSESEEALRNEFEKLENEVVRNGNFGGDVVEGDEGIKEPLLGEEKGRELRFPWMKFGMLVIIWFSFFFIYLLRGNRDRKSIIPIEPCGVGYWILSSFQIPLAIIFTVWILLCKHTNPDESKQTGAHAKAGWQSNKLLFPVMAFLAGMLGGVFGIGGGMLISPLLLQVGIPPEVTAATCSFMVFFSSSMSAFQYLLLGMGHIEAALIFSCLCFIGSLIGLMVVHRAIEKYGRASLIVFSVGTVMALSTVLLTSFGAMGVWEDYAAGQYMGFKLPC